MAADGHGFLVSVLVTTLLLLNCTATWDFGSNVPVTIGVTNLAVNKTEICFLFKSTAEFMVSIYMPNARDVQHVLLFSRASLRLQETLRAGFGRFTITRRIFIQFLSNFLQI